MSPSANGGSPAGSWELGAESSPPCNNLRVQRPPVLVTSRAEKALEAKRLGFDLVCVPLDLPELQALDPGEIVETKARAAYAVLQRPVIVEDSGLFIGAWEGFPGALIKWLERSAGVAALPRMLDGFDDRTATAVCAIAYFDGSRIVAARGEASGRIASAPRGSGGFGLGGVLFPGGRDRPLARRDG